MTRRLTLALLAASLAAYACRSEAPAPKPAESAPPAAAVAGDAPSPLAAYLPSSGTPAGWARTKPVQAYGPDNLWEFINGAAETYVSYGFQQALGTGFSHTGADVGVEIYEMAGTLHAFGIFAQERPPSAQALSAGEDAYANGNVVVFRKGACYAKLIAPASSQPGLAALTALAGSLAAKIPAGAPLPPALSAFPSANLVPNSRRFVPRDVLGQQGLVNGFEASYQEGNAVSRLVAIPFDTAKNAASAFASYRAFVSQSAKTSPAPRGTGDEAFSGTDTTHGHVLAARSGATMAISLGAQTEATAASLVGGYLRAAAAQDKR
jgi:hypothetical protein